MDKQHLHGRLQQLHGELQQVELVDEKERRVLEQLMADIKELLEPRGERPRQKYDRLGQRLRESIEQLEASHPAVTMLMGQVVDMLAKIGI